MTEADNSDVVLMVIIFSACFNQALSLGIRFYSYYYYHCKNNYYYYNIFYYNHYVFNLFCHGGWEWLGSYLNTSFTIFSSLTVELIIPRTTLIDSYNQRSENKADCFSLHVLSWWSFQSQISASFWIFLNPYLL